jgi:protein-L-isoaspartate O-methyltransferase
VDRFIELFRQAWEAVKQRYEKSGRRLSISKRDGFPVEKGCYWPTPRFVTAYLCGLEVHKGDSFLDCGGGDGVLSCTVSSALGIPATSVEIYEPLHDVAVELRTRAITAGLLKDGLVTLINGDFRDVDFSQHSIVYYFNKGTRSIKELLAKMLEVRTGSRIIIYGYEQEIEDVLSVCGDFVVSKLHVHIKIYTRVNEAMRNETNPPGCLVGGLGRDEEQPPLGFSDAEMVTREEVTGEIIP